MFREENLKTDCSPTRDRLEQLGPTVSREANQYTLSFHLPPHKLDKLKVYLEDDRVVIRAEFLRRLETAEGTVTSRLPYERVVHLPPQLCGQAFFPLLEKNTLQLTLFKNEHLSRQSPVTLPAGEVNRSS